MMKETIGRWSWTTGTRAPWLGRRISEGLQLVTFSVARCVLVCNERVITRRMLFSRSSRSNWISRWVAEFGEGNEHNINAPSLPLQKVSSVKEALEMLVVKDQLEGVTCTKTNQEVAAWQQYTLEKLPMVLILHLKLFDYNMGGCTKILKTVSFPIELKIDTSKCSC